MKLSVIIPAYNEAANLKSGVLDQVDSYLKEQDYSYEVVIVDDGSTDNSVELIKEQISNKKGFRLVENAHGGKAITTMTGLLAGKGEVVLFTDLDQSTPLDQVEQFFPKFDEGFDVVIGSREGRKGAPLVRKLSAWGFSLLRTVILGLPFKDTQCGFKAFTDQAAQEIFGPLLVEWQRQKAKKAAVNAGWDVELLFIAKKKGLKIAEVPVEWHYVGTERVQLIGDAVEAVKDMLKVRVNNLRGVYN